MNCKTVSFRLDYLDTLGIYAINTVDYVTGSQIKGVVKSVDCFGKLEGCVGDECH